jgi:GPH family glycoside/pentoside/hexuronide:cation symporter
MTRQARTSASAYPTAGGLSGVQVWAYALAIWPLCIGQQAMIFAGPYFAHQFGLPLALLGLAMTGGRIFDACADMSVAYASDRIRTPLGRRRPWVTVGMLLFLPALWYVFVPGAHYSIGRYALGLLLFFLTWTVAFIPYLAQGTEIASGHAEKSRVNIAQSAVMLAAFLGSYILPFVLVDKSLQGVRAHLGADLVGLGAHGLGAWLQRPPATGVASYGEIMWVIVGLTTVVTPFLLAGYLWKVPDRTGPRQEQGSLLAAFKNPVFLRFSSGHLLVVSGFLGSYGVLPYMLAFVFGRPDLVLLLSLTHVVAQMAATPLWSRLFQRLERRACIALAALLQVAAVLLFLVTPAHNPVMLFVDYAAYGLSGQTLMMGCFLVAGECADYSRWKTGQESRAVHVSLLSLVIKAAYIVGSLLIVLLGLLGFNPSATHQSAVSILTLKGAGLLLPCAMMLVGAAIVWTYPLNRNRVRAIQRRLDRRGAVAEAIPVMPMELATPRAGVIAEAAG